MKAVEPRPDLQLHNYRYFSSNSVVQSMAETQFWFLYQKYLVNEPLHVPNIEGLLYHFDRHSMLFII
jgi:hypothetical protein